MPICDMPLKIRKEQMAVFASARVQQLEGEIQATVLTHWAHVAGSMSSEELRARIRRAIQRAGKYGINTSADCQRFVNLTFLLGEGFDDDPRYPWAAAFLSNSGVSGSTRLLQLCEWTQTLIDRGKL